MNWNSFIREFADLIERNDYLDPETSDEKYIQDNITTSIETNVWKPDLKIPGNLLIKNPDNKIIILSAFANQNNRLDRSRSKDIKGILEIQEVQKKIEESKLPVKFYHCNNIASKDMKYVQSQADIVVDQLYYGQIGSFARECLALGKPIIGYLKQGPYSPKILQDCPILSVDHGGGNLYELILELIDSPKKRKDLGKKRREFALKYYSTDTCAEKLKKVYDKLDA